MARSDEIDALVSSVRNLVSHKDAVRQMQAMTEGRLILTPDLRIEGDAPEQDIEEIDDTRSDDANGPLVLGQSRHDDLAGLEATIAELEAAVTAQSDGWEPDGGENFDPRAWAASAFQIPETDSPDMAPEIAPEPDQTDPDHQDLQARQTDIEPEVANALAAAIDEAALRALVVDIVHDELGGELGERITRNVRKLVRREINRVLASRDMGQM